jgi:hypothetical protein
MGTVMVVVLTGAPVLVRVAVTVTAPPVGRLAAGMLISNLSARAQQ